MWSAKWFAGGGRSDARIDFIRGQQTTRPQIMMTVLKARNVTLAAAEASVISSTKCGLPPQRNDRHMAITNQIPGNPQV